jgi:hypothetical protein
MIPDGWIQIAFNVAVLMALVFAVLTALVVPHGRHKARISEVKHRPPPAAERLIHRRFNRKGAIQHPDTQAKTPSWPDLTELR